jgi:hypothetical protein
MIPRRHRCVARIASAMRGSCQPTLAAQRRAPRPWPHPRDVTCQTWTLARPPMGPMAPSRRPSCAGRGRRHHGAPRHGAVPGARRLCGRRGHRRTGSASPRARAPPSRHHARRRHARSRRLDRAGGAEGDPALADIPVVLVTIVDEQQRGPPLPGAARRRVERRYQGRVVSNLMRRAQEKVTWNKSTSTRGDTARPDRRSRKTPGPASARPHARPHRGTRCPRA